MPLPLPPNAAGIANATRASGWQHDGPSRHRSIKNGSKNRPRIRVASPARHRPAVRHQTLGEYGGCLDLSSARPKPASED